MATKHQITLPAEAEPTRQRLEFIDNLRWLMILLVVSMHAAVTYSHLGSWYFMEDPRPDLGVTIFFATYQTFPAGVLHGVPFLCGRILRARLI